MMATRVWVGASVVVLALAAYSTWYLGIAGFLYAIVSSSLDLQRWHKSPRFMNGELVTPFLSPEANAARKHAFAEPDLDQDPVYLPAYIYRGSDRNSKDPVELDCKDACRSGRLPLLSLQPGKDCSYSRKDIQDAKGLDDLRIHHRCAATPLAVITRPDGRIQWAFDGRPLYYYPKGEHQIESGWEKVQPAYYNSQGILVDSEGMTLYVRRDATLPLGKSQCGLQCQEAMIPFTTQFPFDWDGATQPRFMMGMFGNDGHPASNEDPQWEINGQYLYLHKHDKIPGDQKAVSSSGGYWQTVKRSTPPFRGVVLSGEKRRLQLYTYAEKIPVYVFTSKFSESRECVAACLNDFIPYLKTSSRQSWAGPLDAIAIKENQSGREQWAYDGRFMYIPNLKAGKSEAEFNQSAAQLGLTTIVVDSCYVNDTECQKKLKVNIDRVYWLP